MKLFCGLLNGPEHNYAKFDSGFLGTGVTLSGDGLTVTKDSASWGTSYLTVAPTSGKWAIEITVPTMTVGSPFRLCIPGITTTRTTNVNINAIAEDVSYTIYNGDEYRNNALLQNDRWDTITATKTHLMLIDADARKIGFLKSGALLLGGGALSAGTLYIGISQFDGVAGTFAVTLNAGQFAFTGANETLLAAFETANGVTYNRGLWTP